MPSISVIIPCYNVGKYIETAVNSILQQTFNDFELILVNDGSTDNTLELCDHYASQDSRIRVSHSDKNNGVSNARNIGLECVSGKYVFFCDGDDYIDNDAFEIMIKTSEEYNCDLLICGYSYEIHKIGKDNKLHIDNYPICWDNNVFYSSKELLKKDLIALWNKSLMYNACNKLYRLDIVKSHNILFSTNLIMGEDCDFTNQYFMHCNSFYVLSDHFYHYIRERIGSATSSYISDWFKIRLEEHERFINFFYNCGIYNSEAKEFVSRRFIERVVGCIENELNTTKNTVSLIKKVKNIKYMISHLHTRESLKYAKLTSKKMQIIVLPIRFNSVSMTYAVGMLISVVRKKLPDIFIKLKQSR